MQYKPHIEIDMARAVARIRKAGRSANLLFNSKYNSPYLRTLPGHKRYQFL